MCQGTPFSLAPLVENRTKDQIKFEVHLRRVLGSDRVNCLMELMISGKRGAYFTLERQFER